MPKIIQLSPHIANLIAAGEVVERPASVVKELLENAVDAGASKVTVEIRDGGMTFLRVTDNGCGMSDEQVKKVTDPFYTTRTTRKVGLGVPFFKEAAEQAGGSFAIVSQQGVGTTVTANFLLNHIDRMPMGDLTATMHTLITMHEEKDFIFTYTVNDKSFTLDTRELKEILGEISFKEFEVSNYIKDYLKENITSVTGETII